MRRLLAIPLVLLLTTGASAALATWNPAGNPVCTAPGFQGELLALPIPFGEVGSNNAMFTCWSDARDSVPSVTDIYFDLIDGLGDVTYSNGSPVVIAPGFQGYAAAALTGVTTGPLPPFPGGVVVAWSDDRNGALDIYARRVVGSTETPWPTDGVPVCTAAGAQSGVVVAGDAGANATLAWLDARDAFNAIYAQRLDANGVPQWAANGVPVCTVPATRLFVTMTPAPGGVYVAWADTRSGPYHAYLTRLGADGSPVAGWPIDGLEVSGPISQLGSLLPADDGGAFLVVWSDAAVPAAIRVDGDGSVHAGWPAGGIALRSSGVSGTLQDAIGFGDGLVVLWAEDIDPGKGVVTDLFAQRIGGDGARPAGWGADGNLVCDAAGDQFNARLAAAPAIVAIWEDSRAATDAPDLYAVRLLGNGARDPAWPANGVKVAGGGGRQSSARPVWDGVGGVMLAYLDDHDYDSNQTDVYAQIVSLSGQVEVPRRISRSFDLAAPVPNPATVAVSLALSASSGAAVRAEVLDALGRRIRTLAPGGASALRWDLTDDAGRRVEPGLYYVRVRTATESAAQVVVVRR
jgi:hypothetical protein